MTTSSNSAGDIIPWMYTTTCGTSAATTYGIPGATTVLNIPVMGGTGGAAGTFIDPSTTYTFPWSPPDTTDLNAIINELPEDIQIKIVTLKPHLFARITAPSDAVRCAFKIANQL